MTRCADLQCPTVPSKGTNDPVNQALHLSQWGMAQNHRRWSELRPRTRALIAVGAALQIGLLAAAQADIRRRRPDQLNGPRWVWVAVAFVNFVGPVAYFLFGRRPTPPA